MWFFLLTFGHDTLIIIKHLAVVVKGLTHLAVNQAFVSSSLIIRPILKQRDQW